jgi:hypothetical protein
LTIFSHSFAASVLWEGSELFEQPDNKSETSKQIAGTLFSIIEVYKKSKCARRDLNPKPSDPKLASKNELLLA